MLGNDTLLPVGPMRCCICKHLSRDTSTGEEKTQEDDISERKLM